MKNYRRRFPKQMFGNLFLWSIFKNHYKTSSSIISQNLILRPDFSRKPAHYSAPRAIDIKERNPAQLPRDGCRSLAPSVFPARLSSREWTAECVPSALCIATFGDGAISTYGAPLRHASRLPFLSTGFFISSATPCLSLSRSSCHSRDS